MATTYAYALREALWTVLEAQRVATPSYLRKNFRFRPGSFAEAPVGYVSRMDELLAYDAGTRSREITATVEVVAPFPTDGVTGDTMDALKDYLIDRFTTAVSQIAGTVLELVGVSDGEVSASGPTGDVYYRDVTFTFRGRTWEGRN